MSEHRNTASFGPQHQVERAPLQQAQHSVRVTQSIRSPVTGNFSHQFVPLSAQVSAGRHGRKPSEVVGSSQRTELAHQPAHIVSANPTLQNINSNFQRKPSDFSFASGSIQKGGNAAGPGSASKSPRLVSPGQSARNPGPPRGRAGSQGKGSNLNSDSSGHKQFVKVQANMGSSQTLVGSSRESNIYSHRQHQL